MNKKRLITSALPYVNNIPHLGNLIQVLSADVFARFCRARGYETLYICGTDEYGTATETRALEEGISPRELCDKYNEIHNDIYEWFNISFDRFGRTSTPKQTEITQHLFKKLDEAGYISEKTIEQLFCPSCNRFLADRYVHGTCPACSYEEARGDQCENCGKLLDPTDLINPRCGTCGAEPVLKSTDHLYINLPAILPLLQEWMDKRSVEGFWARNAIQMTKSWIRDGLHERCITRDLKWGIPVPKPGFEGKVFYVWFDAPIGYISITANHTDDWKNWWQDPDNVELFQFIGKDNIPFHTVVFPSTLLGSGEHWTTLYHMSSSEYLNYENEKFSKSKGKGVFGNQVKDTGIPADIWRFYIYYIRPEKADAMFTWSDFQEKVNSELIGNLGNLVNRTLTFVSRFYDAKLPAGERDEAMWNDVEVLRDKVTAHLERAELRDAIRTVFQISSTGNKAFQDGEPWKTRTTEPDKAGALLRNLTLLIHDLAIMIAPFLPATAHNIAVQLGLDAASSLSWDRLGKADIQTIGKPEILFKRLEPEQIDDLRERYSGKDQTQAEEKKPETEALFRAKVELRVAKITAIERHPEAEKLYIETISLGDTQRQIVSGLVPYYSEEELLGKNIILVANLKPANLRGVKSEGMLLAADDKQVVEVLFVEGAAPGSRVVLSGDDPAGAADPGAIKIDQFFEIPIHVKDSFVMVGNTALVCNGKEIRCSRVQKGEVG
ncbi:MAG: methionine--tRNA ligase [Spirochaetales bacterium]|nr:methionine--tRNA ligase [Spirochaetales bacterium]